MGCMFPLSAGSSGLGGGTEAVGRLLGVTSAQDQPELCIYLANICKSGRSPSGTDGVTGLTLLGGLRLGRRVLAVVRR